MGAPPVLLSPAGASSGPPGTHRTAAAFGRVIARKCGFRMNVIIRSAHRAIESREKRRRVLLPCLAGGAETREPVVTQRPFIVNEPSQI